MDLFDFNVGIGRAADPVGGSFDTASDLLREMDRLGIAEALVFHRLASEGDVLLGNRALLDLIRGHPRLHPCWVMTPSALGDLPEPERWVRDVLDEGVRAVRLQPSHSLYNVRSWNLAPLSNAVADAGLPLVFDFGLKHWSQKTVPWDEIRELCLAQTRLRVVLLGATVGDAREAVRLLEQLPNFYLETHALPLPELYERLATAGHTGKVLFGTGMPRRAGECAASQIRMAGVSQRELTAMGGGNARRLLNLLSSPRPSSGIHDSGGSVEAPRELVRVVDVHTHIGSWERVTIPLSTAEGFIQSMDRCCINQIIFSSFSAIHGEQRLGNQEAALEAAKFPNRLYAYCAINPHYPGEIEEELQCCFEGSEVFVGLKFHCGLHCAQLHHAGYERALGFAQERSLPVLVHGGGSDRWREICERYPCASFIMAHACAWDGRDEAGREIYRLARDIENLYLDVSGSPAHRGGMEALVDLVGESKVLYGSDFPMFDFGFEVGRVTGSHLSPTTQRAVLEGNARRLFRSLA